MHQRSIGEFINRRTKSSALRAARLQVGEFINRRTKSSCLTLRPYFTLAGKCLLPLTAKSVQGGWATIKSQSLLSTSSTGPW